MKAWIKRIYLIVLRDLAAAQFMAGMQKNSLSSLEPDAKKGDTVGMAMARRSFHAASEFIKVREQIELEAEK